MDEQKNISNGIVCPFCMLDYFTLDPDDGKYWCPSCGNIMGGGNVWSSDDVYRYQACDEDEDDEPHDRTSTRQSNSTGGESHPWRPEPYDEH